MPLSQSTEGSHPSILGQKLPILCCLLPDLPSFAHKLFFWRNIEPPDLVDLGVTRLFGEIKELWDQWDTEQALAHAGRGDWECHMGFNPFYPSWGKLTEFHVHGNIYEPSVQEENQKLWSSCFLKAISPAKPQTFHFRGGL